MKTEYLSFLLSVIILQCSLFGCNNPAQTKFLFLSDKFITSTNFEIINRSEIKKFKNIVNLTNQLNISTNNIQSIYEKTKQLQVAKDKKLSLLARPTPDSTKLAQINSEISTAEGSINSLGSSVMTDLSALNDRKKFLVNHINTITGKTYITYDPADKPDSVGGYSDSIYFSDLDITNLLSDGVTLYAPDEGDPDQDNLKEAWEVDQERVEILDPTNIFDAAKVLSDEIQTAKDLITDFNTNSTTNDIYNNPEAIETLHTLLDNIKDHTVLLSSKAKKYSDDYSANAQKMKVTDALKAYFLLQLAEVNNKLESGDSFTLQALKNSFENESFSVKLNDNNAFSRFRGLPSQESINQVIDKYGALAVEYFNKPLFDHEKATIKFYGYSQSEWDALKAQDAQAAKDLVDATVEMARAVQIPATYGDVALSAFTLFKSAKALSKVNLKDVKEFATQAKALKNELVNISESLKKFFNKNLTKDCLNGVFSTSSFQTQGFSVKSNSPCDLFIKKAKFTFPKVAGGRNNKGIKEFPHLIGLPETIQRATAATKKLLKKDIDELKKIPNYPQSIITLAEKFKNDGITKEAGTGFPKFIDYVVKDLSGTKLSFTYTSGFSTKVGNAGRDFDFIKVCKEQKVIDFITSVASLEQLGRLINKTGDTHAREILKITQELKLTWHHVEDLKTLQLIPRSIHEKVAHLGGKGIWDTIKDKKLITITEFKNWLNGKLGS